MVYEPFQHIEQLKEDADFEFKKAAGADGRGELPSSFFATYVAMANTYGGNIAFGIAEDPQKRPVVTGIQNVPKVLKSLWDGLNDRKRVSANLLSADCVRVVDLDGRNVIAVRVPRARRGQRPVYVGENPLTGTLF